MTSSGRRLRSAFLGLGLGLALAAASSGANAQAKTPSPEELKAARELFQDAYKDEQEKRYAPALEKFQRVAAVKESASVRYRIGSVLESVGRLRESRDAFRALAASKPNLPPPEQEIADSAAERAHQLDKKIPRILLQLQENPPPDVRVSIDGAPVPVTTAPRAVELDPGEHLVQASAPTSRPSESRVTLNEGSEVGVVVVLTPIKAAKGPPPPPPSAQADTSPRGDKTLAYVALGAGGALLVTGIVLLAVREGDISDIEKECRDGTCPVGKKVDLEATHDRAELFGPLGIGVGLLGLAAIGVGGYLFFRRAPAATTSAPSAGLRLSPRPVQGGAMVGLSATF
jgi:hypothetical protein